MSASIIWSDPRDKGNLQSEIIHRKVRVEKKSLLNKLKGSDCVAIVILPLHSY